MFVVFTAILSFLTSCLPNVMKYFEEKQRLKANVQIRGMELEAAVRNIQAMETISKIKGELDDSANARNSDSNYSDGTFINFIRATVRPVLTYTIFFLYIGIKLTAGFILLSSGLTIENAEAAVKIILDETTITILMIIVSFYFGSRANLMRVDNK